MVVGQHGRWSREVLPAGGAGPDESSQPPDFRFYSGAGSGKLQDILKDGPRKYSLRTPGLVLKVSLVCSVLKFLARSEHYNH